MLITIINTFGSITTIQQLLFGLAVQQLLFDSKYSAIFIIYNKKKNTGIIIISNKEVKDKRVKTYERVKKQELRFLFKIKTNCRQLIKTPTAEHNHFN